MEDLDGILAHAATLLVPGGQVIIEEFAWERVADGYRESARACMGRPGFSGPETLTHVPPKSL